MLQNLLITTGLYPSSLHVWTKHCMTLLCMCMDSTTHTHHTKFSPFTSDAAYLEVWDHVLCNTNKVLGEKPAKRTFGRLFTTKELETWGSIAGIYAPLITIVAVHVHVVHFGESVQHALKANCSW